MTPTVRVTLLVVAGMLAVFGAVICIAALADGDPITGVIGGAMAAAGVAVFRRVSAAA